MLMPHKVGEKFNRWTVLGKSLKEYSNPYWHCRCDCGTEKDVRASRIRSGESKSCGCYSRQRASETARTHGKSKTSEYNIWRKMLRRCFNPQDGSYTNYGLRGITVCERWLSFENFLEDMGTRPTIMHSLERRENGGNYEPDNCYWATRVIQNNNKRSNIILTHNNISHTMKEWSEITGLRYTRFWYLIRARNVTLEQIMNGEHKKLKTWRFSHKKNKTV